MCDKTISVKVDLFPFSRVIFNTFNNAKVTTDFTIDKLLKSEIYKGESRNGQQQNFINNMIR
jgi:hypothetical protein